MFDIKNSCRNAAHVIAYEISMHTHVWIRNEEEERKDENHIQMIKEHE
jgi:hypothetical protein